MFVVYFFFFFFFFFYFFFLFFFFFFSSRRRHTRSLRDWSSDVCSSDLAADAVRAGTPASAYQAMVCDYFEQRGHATIRSNPTTTEGYVHSLGHGVGLDIHEKPSFALTAMNGDVVEAGDIITIEPGLYFPDREIGVRIEDTFVIGGGGRAHTLCRGSYGLEP